MLAVVVFFTVRLTVFHLHKFACGRSLAFYSPCFLGLRKNKRWQSLDLGALRYSETGCEFRSQRVPSHSKLVVAV